MRKRPEAQSFWFDRVTGRTFGTKKNENCEYFHSTLEFRIYHKLKSAVGKSGQVFRQTPIEYKPATAIYPSLDWRVDFSVQIPDKPIIYLEAKGQWVLHQPYALGELQHKLQFLQYTNEEAYRNLIFLDEKEWRIDRYHQTIPLSKIEKLILKFQFLKPDVEISALVSELLRQRF